jgi:hypothetical protein
MAELRGAKRGDADAVERESSMIAAHAQLALERRAEAEGRRAAEDQSERAAAESAQRRQSEAAAKSELECARLDAKMARQAESEAKRAEVRAMRLQS